MPDIKKKSVLATASVMAIVLAAPAAFAASAASPNMWISAEGDYAMMRGKAVGTGHYDSSLHLRPHDGWGGGIKAGAKVYGDWFLEGGLRYDKSGRDKFSNTIAPNFTDSAKYNEHHLVLDFQVGRDIGLGGGTSVKLFGGLRYASFKGRETTNYQYYGSPSQLGIKDKFNGFGPRVGVEATIPLAHNISVDMGGSFAELYGKRKFDAVYTDTSGTSQVGGSSKHWVPNLEASVALTYSFTPNASVSAGYRLSQYWNVMPKREGLGVKYADRLINGPFLTLTFKD